MKLRYLNNPEEGLKVGTEDTSSGSAAANKLTAATTE